jgi:hypothetical protein
MAHPQSEDIQFKLPIAADKLKEHPVNGEDAVNAYIAAGMPADVACGIVDKVTNSEGVIDPDLFVECMQQRLKVADALHGFLAKKAQKKK